MQTASLLQSAVTLHQSGQLEDAEKTYRLILRLEPKNADALALLGTLLSGKKLHDEAIALIEQALAVDPAAPLFNFHLGNAYEKSGQHAKAEAAFARAVSLAPDWAEAYYNLGNAQRTLKKHAEAKTSYLKALALNPNHILCYNNLAHVFSDLMDYPNVRANLEAALRIDPDNTQILFSSHDLAHEHNDLPTAFNAAHRLAGLKLGVPKGQDIIAFLEDNKNINTGDEQIRNCLFALGASYFLDSDLERSSYVLRMLLAMEPDLAEAALMLGSVMLAQNKPELADHYYAQTFMLNPSETAAPWNRSMDLLVSGNLLEGFRRYHWRWSTMEKFKAMRMHGEMWDGQNPSGKTIVVQEEQGFGDTLQMLRFLPMLKAKGATVYAYVRPELFTLIGAWDAMNDGKSKIVSWVVTDKSVPPEVDAVCGMMDLPAHLGIGLNTIPATVPYIPNPKKGMPAYKLDGKGLKVGFVWSGNPLHKRNYVRSYPFEILEDIIKMDGFSFYSLQFKPQPEDIALMEKWGVTNLAPRIKDLADTAACLAELDLLITVDSAPAHLAGALGLPVWTLLTHDPDWRWLLERDDSPWYPSMRLFRQAKMADWASVMVNVKKALAEFASKSAR